MVNPTNSEEFYNNLKEKLQDTSMWPTEYLYKFIIKSDVSKIKLIDGIFDNMGAVITSTPSKKGTYMSISINVVMQSPETVIRKYQLVASQVEGVISL